MMLVFMEFIPHGSASCADNGSPISGSEWIGRPAPEIAPGEWINVQRTTLASLKCKVVLLEFWTYGCYNCRNTLPSIKAWYKKILRAGFPDHWDSYSGI